MFKAAIFDLDGVLTDTAGLHEQAWRDAVYPMPLTHEDYETYFDGRSREAGLYSFLRAQLTEANEAYCNWLMEKKAKRYEQLLTEQPIKIYPDTAKMILSMFLEGKPLAVASSSKMAPKVMEVTKLAPMFAFISAGEAPKPKIYEIAAEKMGVPISDCIIFEDSRDAVTLAISTGAKYVTYMRKDR